MATLGSHDKVVAVVVLVVEVIDTVLVVVVVVVPIFDPGKLQKGPVKPAVQVQIARFMPS